jgi:glycosyltransferase involved in cell wall biosynthesis
MMSDSERRVQAITPRSRTAPKEVCVIIPALNEERTIGRVIRRIPRESLRVLGYTPRVLVADGHSVDATLKIARARGAEIIVQRGKGKGKAMREVHERLLEDAWDSQGRARQPRYYAVLDADCTYPPETITDLVVALDSGYDVVLASRFLGFIHPGAMTRLNRMGNRVLTRLFRLLNGVDLTDICTGMYAFNERVFRNLSLEADGFDVEADLFSCASHMKARFAEVPVDYSRRLGKPKLTPLNAGLRIGLRMLIRRVRRGDGQVVLPRAPSRTPHPFIAWAERLRDPHLPGRMETERPGLALNQFMTVLGRSEASGSQRGWERLN